MCLGQNVSGTSAPEKLSLPHSDMVSLNIFIDHLIQSCICGISGIILCGLCALMLSIWDKTVFRYEQHSNSDFSPLSTWLWFGETQQ